MRMVGLMTASAFPPSTSISLHAASKYGGKNAGRPYFVAGERLSRAQQHTHFYDVARNKIDGLYKRRSSVSHLVCARIFIDCEELSRFNVTLDDLYAPP